MPAVARLVTARWTRWTCPLNADTGCGFHFDLPELELQLDGERASLTVGYGDHAAQQEFFAAVQAEHERLDHPELVQPLSAEQEALVERLSTGLGVPSPRRSTATRTGVRPGYSPAP